MFNPQADGKAFRNRHNLNGRFVVLYAGAHGMSNDLQVLLQAAGLLRENPLIQFVLIGDGKEKQALIRQAEGMKLDNVLFLPPAPKDQMDEVFAGSDACIAILKPLELYK